MNGQVDLSNCRALTIQSHVVSGYVGNKIALYTLQVCGFETDAINSVQLSNHSHYKHFPGQILNAKELQELYEGLQLNELNQKYTHLLTGYVNSETFLLQLHEIVKDLKKENPGLIYLCDPVLGDYGRLYVNSKLIQLYKEKMLPLADVITPNQFETETLCDRKITCEKNVIDCIDMLHLQGPDIVVVSSVEFPDNIKELIGYASQKITNANTGETSFHRFKIHIPKYEGNFVGTGDLFAAVMLSALTKNRFDVKLSLEQSIATLQSVLIRTVQSAQKQEGGLNKFCNIELRLVQSLDDVRNPKVQIQAIEL